MAFPETRMFLPREAIAGMAVTVKIKKLAHPYLR
jgi:hypothetical protein